MIIKILGVIAIALIVVRLALWKSIYHSIPKIVLGVLKNVYFVALWRILFTCQLSLFNGVFKASILLLIFSQVLSITELEVAKSSTMAVVFSISP